MNLLDLTVRIGAKDEASGVIGNVGTMAIAKGVAVGQAMTAAMTKAANAVADGVKAVVGGSFEAYASYEQLVGGVDKLFGEASGKLQEYAARAYETSGMSANQYMEQATSFSAALISSLAGDTEKAADQADKAMRAMSDNVNVFGSNMEDVQNAFQGFAKQNYTMLDNLKLGYGGTKEEMQRLIDDANEYAKTIGEASDLSIDSFSDIVDAIDLVQRKQNIAGTTAKEAATTIEGSLNMLRASWKNWLAELGKSDADMGKLTGELVASFESAARNVVPRIATILGTVLGSVPGIVAEVGPAAAEALKQTFLDAAATFHDMLPEEAQQAMNDAKRAIADSGLAQAARNVMDALGRAADLAASAAGRLGEAWAPVMEDLMGLVAAVEPVVTGFFDAFGSIVGEHVVPALEQLAPAVGGVFDMLSDMIGALTQSEEAAKAQEGVMSALGKAFDVVGTALQAVADVVGDVAGELFDLIEGSGALDMLADALQGVTPLLEGLQAVLEAVWDVAGAFLDGLFEGLGEIQPVLEPLGEAFSSLCDAVGALLEAFAPVVEMLTPVAEFLGERLGEQAALAVEAFGWVVQAVVDVVNHITGFVNFIAGVPEAVSQFVNGVVTWFQQLPGKIKEQFDAVVQGAIEWVSSVVEQAESAGSQFVSSVEEWFGGVPDMIKGFFDGAGDLLWGIGEDIIDGLLGGLRAAWDGVTGFIGGIGDWIVQHKGPPAYDKVMLVENGRLIMQGLADGLRSGMGGVASAVGDATSLVSGIGGTGSAVGFSGGVGGSGNVSIGELHVHVDQMATVEQWQGFVSMLRAAKAMA